MIDRRTTETGTYALMEATCETDVTIWVRSQEPDFGFASSDYVRHNKQGSSCKGMHLHHTSFNKFCQALHVLHFPLVPDSLAAVSSYHCHLG